MYHSVAMNIENLLAQYRRAFREDHYSGMWKRIFEAHHRPLHEVFMRGPAEAALEILRNPISNYLHYGFENTCKGFQSSTNKDPSALRCLSEAIGTERLVNPTHDAAAIKLRNFRRSLEGSETILSRIDARLGRIDFPNPFPGEGGTTTSRGIASHRAIQAIYQASLLKGRVVEIGGGLGRTAYYAHRFGITDYTIVDLPFTGISQGYFLGVTLGVHPVRLISPDEFFASSETYDVALNVDSLTELSRVVAEKYAGAIKARAKRFISINHESNGFTVGDLFAERKSRHPYWFRTGYVEEHF